MMVILKFTSSLSLRFTSHFVLGSIACPTSIATFVCYLLNYLSVCAFYNTTVTDSNGLFNYLHVPPPLSASSLTLNSLRMW